jgi:PST family polysaccharide transporter
MNSSRERKEPGLVAIHGTAWRYVSYFGGKLIGFLSTLILARLLARDEFGVVGYALTAIAFLDVASDLGMAEAVVYFKEDKRNNSTAFWISLGIGVILFGLSWIMSPLLATYFHDERVLEINRILALTFPINALGSTHEAILRKNLAFGRITIPVFLRAVTKGLTSIILAFMGFGAWSLVWGQIFGTMIASLLFWILSPWRPHFDFNPAQAASLLRYGVRDIVSNFLSMILLNLDYWLVGHFLGAEALGIYTLSYRLPELVILQFARIINQVNFPIYTQMHESNAGLLARGFRKTTEYVALVTVPFGIGLALLAQPFTLVFFSEKWRDAIPVLQAVALYAMFLSLFQNASSVYKAQGNFKTLNWLSLARLALLFPALYWATAIKGSIVAVGWMHALIAFIGAILGVAVASRMLGLRIWDLFTSIRPALLAGIAMAGVLLVAINLTGGLSSFGQLLISVSVGALAYALVLWITSRRLILEIIRNLKSALFGQQAKIA